VSIDAKPRGDDDRACDAAVAIADIRRRFLVLQAMRWLPNGLLVPVFVLLLIDRGFTLSQLGVVFAVQGLTVFALELPTGGLADALGRRPVLMAATALDAVALALLITADTLTLLAVFALMQGVYRALESGPLDAWLVDALHEVDPEANVESAIGGGGVATGLSISTGAMIAAGLVAIGPINGVDALILPVVVAAAARLVDLTALALLMREERRRSGLAGIAASLREVPTVIATTVAAVRASHVLAALIAVELFWGFGMVTFEPLVPVRLAEVAGDPQRAAALFGPAAAAAWLVSAGGAWSGPKLAQITGTATAAMILHAGQAATVVGMALLAGPIGVLGSYLLTMGAHGSLNPLYKALLHRQASPENRTTVLSAASMAGFPGFALGAIVLGAVADKQSVSTAMIVGALVLLCAIPLYLPARNQSHQSTHSRTTSRAK
jgi:MFS family permease